MEIDNLDSANGNVPYKMSTLNVHADFSARCMSDWADFVPISLAAARITVIDTCSPSRKKELKRNGYAISFILIL